MTGRSLLNFLNSLTPEQLDDFDMSVSEGCDENGNAELYTLDGVCIVGDGTIDAAADGVLEYYQPVLLYNTDPN